ncbi:30S ribosomal protein S12 methylthiotransferase RimO [Stomatohabitans albus]|uniref:30S ribosomal protein S12 methylthiotransferase RimO n=1 Tax=Stomatohabitans albus TaxID=3110766 RepID=UPI00300D8C1C
MKPVTEMNEAKVAILTLGCGRNDVDSDNVAGLLAQSGHRLVDDPDDANCIIVNTCTFIGAARAESVDTILDATGTTKPVVVMGCMAERHGDELAKEIPELAGVVGFNDYAALPEVITDAVTLGKWRGTANRGAAAQGGASLPVITARGAKPVIGEASRGLPLLGTMPGPTAPPTAAFPVRTQPRGSWAYLKIAGGCDRICTFCSIPSFRGRFSSRGLAELEAEANWLVSNGVEELVCVSENTTSWGKDLPGGRESQRELVEMFDRVEGLRRVRLMYLQPAEIRPALLEAMAASRTVVPYYDLSMQHASADVLKAMARMGGPDEFLSLLSTIRANEPDAVFRSSFIVGFPGETDRDVEILSDFVQAAGLDWSGVFTYSPEEGTTAATLPNQVPTEVAEERRDHLMGILERVMEERAQRFVGQTLDVLIEEYDEDTGEAIGRSYRESPESDGEIRIRNADTPTGRSIPVRIRETDGVDLIGEVSA